MGEWSVCEFEELFEVPLRNGVTYPSARRGRGVPMVNMREAFLYDQIEDQECERVPLTEPELERFLLREADLLFVRQSLKYEGAGRCVYVKPAPGPRTWEGHLIRVRLDPRRADARYYFYYFKSPDGRRSVETIIEQVAAAGIRGSDLRKLRVPFPKIEQQRAIAVVLGALDDKIAVNERIESTTEQLLGVRFEQLGIDVEPNGNVPIVASDLVEFNPRLKAPSCGMAVYLDMAALPTSAARVGAWSRRLPKSGTRFSNGDTVMARITPCLENGKTGFVDFMDDNEVGVGSTEFIVMRARGGVPRQVPYFLARSSRFRSIAIQNMVGSSGRQRVSAARLESVPLTKPDERELQAFGEAASRAFEHMKSLGQESRVLAQLRDTLLPKLMSGELRVRDAERVVKDAT